MGICFHRVGCFLFSKKGRVFLFKKRIAPFKVIIHLNNHGDILIHMNKGIDMDKLNFGKRKVQQFNKWSSKYNWVARCEAWDVEEEQQRIAAKRESIRKMDERQATYGESLQKIGIINIHAHAGLNVKDKAGKAIEITIPVEESRKLFETGLKAERIARGEVTEISERKHGGAIDIREVEIREQARDD